MITISAVVVFVRSICTVKCPNCTTCVSMATLGNKLLLYKAGFSTLDDLYNLVSKYITKYPVIATYKIFKNIKKHLQFFLYFFMNFYQLFSKFENCKIDIIFSKIFFKISHHSTIL